VIFSNIFLPILYDIELYIYTIKYKSGIIISGFLRNISKTQKTKIQNIRKKYFIAHSQILNFFSSIFFIKKTKTASFSCLNPTFLVTIILGGDS